MTQKERQERSRQMIFQAALEEFGTSEPESVTMDEICAKHGISKGMLYHYYANKDALFLACVEKIFQDLNAYLQQESEGLAEQPALLALKNYFLLRETFFQSRSRERHIFECAMLHPPQHLIAQIQALRQPIRAENERFLRRLISHMQLREGLERNQAVRYLHSVYTVFWSILEQYHAPDSASDLHKLLKETEEIFGLLLFGIARPGDAEQAKA